jgi:nucleoside-diphosphate-sugar epimerase
MVLARPDPNFRVVRLSNVIGPGEKPVMFLPSVSDEARRTGKVLFRTAPESEKDYVAVEDAVAVMGRIALAGKQRLYNVASGRNTTNAEIAELVRKYLAADTAFAPNAPAVSFPLIDIGRAASEFDFAPRPFAHAYARALEPEDIA